MFLLFYASRNAAQSDVTIIVRTGMFSISAVSSIFLREKIGRVRAMAMLIAMIGALSAANPAFDSSGLPLLAALGVVLCDTVSYPLLSFFTGRVHAMIVVLFFRQGIMGTKEFSWDRLAKIFGKKQKQTGGDSVE